MKRVKILHESNVIGGLTGGFQPGRTKQGGRVAGQPNKKTTTIVDAILEACRWHGRMGAKEAHALIHDGEQLKWFLIKLGKVDYRALAFIFSKLIPKDVNIHSQQQVDIKARTSSDIRHELIKDFGIQLPDDLQLLPPRPVVDVDEAEIVQEVERRRNGHGDAGHN